MYVRTYVCIYAEPQCNSHADLEDVCNIVVGELEC